MGDKQSTSYEPRNVLSGVKVIDLGHYLAGPFCGKLLGALGAEVIKVERPGGDPARSLGPFPSDTPHAEKSGIFLYLNTNKKSVTLNLKTPTGVKILKELLKDADILIENFEPRVMPELGLAYAALEQAYPRLVMTSISSFGQTGPYANYRGDDMVALALSGIMYLVGDRDNTPLKSGGYPASYLGGLMGFFGSMAALWHVQRCGEGQQVDVSIMESCAFGIPQQLVEHVYTGRVGKRGPSIIANVFPCKDGIVWAVFHSHHWPKVAQLIGKPEFVNDPRFVTEQARRNNVEEMKAEMLPYMLEHDAEEIYHSSQKLGLPFAYLANVEDVINSDQYKSRNFFVEVEHLLAGKLLYPGLPLTIDRSALQLKPAPLLGEHNEEVYCQKLGYSRDDLVRLREAGVI